MPSKKFTHIIFDMDGVLVDTEPLQMKAELQNCRDFGIDIHEREWENFKGRTAHSIYTYINDNFAGGQHDVSNLIDKKTEILMPLLDQSPTIKGIFEFIEFCQCYFDKIGLATSSNKPTQVKIFEVHKFGKYFDNVMTGDDVSNGKPDPEIYIKSMLNLKVKPENTIIIEDSYSGTKAGLDAGATVITIATSHTRDEILSWGLSNTVASDYEDVKEIIINLNS
jgi:beta-phosphoglucomutase-like phosphatase (HAD superfamily)